MKDNTKNILVIALLVGIVAMTVVYAALSQTLNISGSAQVQGRDSTWNIHFAHLSTLTNEVTTHGYATCAATSVTLDSTTSVLLPQVTLKAPGDKVVFKIKVINEGDVTGILSSSGTVSKGTITYNAGETLTSSEKQAFENAIKVSMKYSDGVISAGDTLSKNQSKEIEITVEFENTQATQKLPSAGANINGITASLVYTQ